MKVKPLWTIVALALLAAPLAAELVRLKVDVIFAPATMAALSAKHAKGTTPIVFAAAGDPIGSGRLLPAPWVSKSTSWP